MHLCNLFILFTLLSVDYYFFCGGEGVFLIVIIQINKFDQFKCKNVYHHQYKKNTKIFKKVNKKEKKIIFCHAIREFLIFLWFFYYHIKKSRKKLAFYFKAITLKRSVFLLGM